MDEELVQQEEEKPAPPESLRILEALLFASDDVLSPAKLKTIVPNEPDARAIRKMVDEINIQLQQQHHPFEIVELGGGYQFRTVPYYQPWVQQLFKEKSAKKVSIQGLECLAIIAYKQPISKIEIEAIRGVLSDGAMKTLLEKRFITISGRSDKPGRPLLYSTSPDFLKYFGINKLADLPKIEEFEAIAKEQIDMFSDTQLLDAEAERTAQEEAEKEENAARGPGETLQAAAPEYPEPEVTEPEQIAGDDETTMPPVKAMFQLDESAETEVKKEWNADDADGADERGSE